MLHRRCIFCNCLYTDTDWPCVFAGNTVVWLSAQEINEKKWSTDVKEVILGGCKKYAYVQRTAKQFNFAFGESASYVRIREDLQIINPFQNTEITHREFAHRVRILAEACCALNDSHYEIQQCVRPAQGGSSDSDDEQQIDAEIPAAFDHDELVVVKYSYGLLRPRYENAKKKRFQNAAGKSFFYHLGMFLLTVLPKSTMCRFQSDISTNPHGNAQPGGLKIGHMEPPRGLRDKQNWVTSIKEKKADYVMFDKVLKMYCIVGEIKSEQDLAESQNTEQMLGLFRKNQRVMLGFTCNPVEIQMRVLHANTTSGTLFLDTVSPPLLLDSPTSLYHVADFFIAFISVVNITF